jgi:hypothetical protein
MLYASLLTGMIRVDFLSLNTECVVGLLDKLESPYFLYQAEKDVPEAKTTYIRPK